MLLSLCSSEKQCVFPVSPGTKGRCAGFILKLHKPMLFIFVASVCAYIFTIESGRPKQEIMLKGIENRIFTGFFEILTPATRNVSVRIYSLINKNNKYLDTIVVPNTKQRFSFNLSEPDDMIVRMTKATPQEVVKIRFHFEMQFDTFNKDVAQKMVVKPAMATLNNFGNMLKSISDQTYERARQISKIRSEHKRSVMLVLVFSLLTIIGFAVLNYYQVMVLKKFFKQKKLI